MRLELPSHLEMTGKPSGNYQLAWLPYLALAPSDPGHWTKVVRRRLLSREAAMEYVDQTWPPVLPVGAQRCTGAWRQACSQGSTTSEPYCCFQAFVVAAFGLNDLTVIRVFVYFDFAWRASLLICGVRLGLLPIGPLRVQHVDYIAETFAILASNSLIFCSN